MSYTDTTSSLPAVEWIETRCHGICDLQKVCRRCFLLLSVGNSLMLVALSAAQLSSHADGYSNSSFTFTSDIAILFIGLVSGWFAFHGIVFEYQYDIYLHLISVAMALIYCWLGYWYGDGEVTLHSIKKIESIVATSLLIPTLALAMCITCSEYWNEFYIAGASEEILTMYKKLCLFLSLLKFDLQTVVVMGIFSLSNGLDSTFLEVLPLIIIIIYGILFWIVVAYGVQKEHPLPLFIFVLGSVAIPIWVTYRFVIKNCFAVSCSRVETGLTSAAFIAGIIAVIVRKFILVELMKVHRNFGYGLSDRAFSNLTSPESTSLLGRPRRRDL